NFQVDVTQVQNWINGTSPQLNNKTMGFGMIFMHEMLHTKVGMGIGHGSEEYTWGGTGKLVNVMNVIRGQLGADYGQRESYMGYTESDGKTYIPFDKQSRGIIYNRVNSLVNGVPSSPI